MQSNLLVDAVLLNKIRAPYNQKSVHALHFWKNEKAQREETAWKIWA
jgi:hypothetical protein